MRLIIVLSILSFKFVAVRSHSSCGMHYEPPVNNSVVCSEIFQIFHKCTGNFLEESLDKANPFTLCTDKKAHGFYRNLTLFLNILQTSRDKKTNVTCIDEYLNKNSMSVISHIVSTAKNIWESAYCDDCYADISSNVQNFSDTTVQFQHAHEKYSNCTQSKNNASVICKECVGYYQTMNELFDHEKHKRDGKICFDLEDMMNKTRLEWSVVYKCCRGKMDSLMAFYSLFSTIISLTILFYLNVYAFGSNSSETTVLDAREIEVHNPDRPNGSGSASSSSNSMPKDNNVSDKAKLIINDDSDDDSNILHASPSPNNNLISLDN